MFSKAIADLSEQKFQISVFGPGEIALRIHLRQLHDPQDPRLTGGRCLFRKSWRVCWDIRTGLPIAPRGMVLCVPNQYLLRGTDANTV
jgi:hypothetical protein